MTSRAVVTAVVELALMVAVVGAYIALARRLRLLWHPASIVAAVTLVSVIVAVAGELLFGGGWPGVPTMLRRSAVGGLAWGLVITTLVWAVRRMYASLAKPR